MMYVFTTSLIRVMYVCALYDIPFSNLIYHVKSYSRNVLKGYFGTSTKCVDYEVSSFSSVQINMSTVFCYPKFSFQEKM